VFDLFMNIQEESKYLVIRTPINTSSYISLIFLCSITYRKRIEKTCKHSWKPRCGFRYTRQLVVVSRIPWKRRTKGRTWIRENANERKGILNEVVVDWKVKRSLVRLRRTDGFTRVRICKCAQPRTNASTPFT